MARTSVVLDASVLVAFLDPREQHHLWAASQADQSPSPWFICEPILTETFFLLESRYKPALINLMRTGIAQIAFSLADELQSVLALMDKYADVPMSLADACIVRMTETLPDPLVLTTDSDFRVYRRHSRHVVPCRMP